MDMLMDFIACTWLHLLGQVSRHGHAFIMNRGHYLSWLLMDLHMVARYNGWLRSTGLRKTGISLEQNVLSGEV